MFVWEKINELKKCNATKEEIADWSYDNRICPLMMDVGLELSENQKHEADMLDKIADSVCHEMSDKNGPGCGEECLDSFLDSEWEDGE